jgi:hypothetical protein
VSTANNLARCALDWHCGHAAGEAAFRRSWRVKGRPHTGKPV